jgi:arsenate reductase
VFDILEEILENPMLISTPIVRNGKVSSLGFVPEQWKKWLA